MEQFADWWRQGEVPVIVATATPEGEPTARAVKLELFDERGFVFWSSSDSPKGKQLAENPRAALVFLWGTQRQVRVEGPVERVRDDENERHWRERPGKRAIAAFRQSEPIRDRSELEQLVQAVAFDPPRPLFWVGYRVVPERVEFWEHEEGFVHDRFRFTRDGDSWVHNRLQP